jgi:PTH1 family peptidyl-tRNA hydrolase
MAASKRLVVGLGNPGPEYESTRHNIGFQVADAIARRAGLDLGEHRYDAHFGFGSWRGRAFGVAKPTTFMNRSGYAVGKLARKFGIDATGILIVYDDIDLPVGGVRLRASGGPGSHNGMESVVARLGTTDIPRLRIGIGKGFPRGAQSEYVLSVFDPGEEAAVSSAVEIAVDAALCFVDRGIEEAMTRFNRRSSDVRKMS